MQLPDSLDETKRLIKANREEFRIIEAKLISGKIHPRSPKWRRLEQRKAKLFDHLQGLATHEMELVRLKRIPFSPLDPRQVQVPIAR
ncbi:MAG: hypothetical protein A2Z42_01610 [Candidatus Woykebacteria bacterium RBG_19FT_COMBO_43_10]|uniref:50S ribosomal protein L29 n=1 Tax=Candidatus Woykebacteria bacterium RBG_19FT_COMBO_43_10 TaxID=1802598 RepID=A0A1G1WIC5_9BACT|nr:MAG: hypothetical protein A2Z42_01610 [Candidatus Woykebacteria bacterium RBG_19FT_COMBO_43_10]